MHNRKFNIFQKQSAPTRRNFLVGLGALAATGPFASASLPQLACNSTATTVASVASGTGTQSVPSGTIVSSTAAVSSSVLGTIGPQFVGFSYEKKNMYQGHTLSASAANMIALFKLLGPGVLRVGGTTVDETLWNAAGAGLQSGYIAPPDVDAVAAFAKATGWRVIYGVNLASMEPALSAAEAAYAVSAFGTNLLGIEIGNEPDLFTDNKANIPNNTNTPLTETAWLPAFEAAVNAILAAAPGTAIVGPAVAGYIGGYLPPFANAVISGGVKNLAVYTMHYYRSGTSSIPSMMVYPDASLTSTTSQIQGYTVASGVPYRIGECNSYAGGGTAGVSNSCASSLWIVNMIFSSAIGGAVGVNVHTAYGNTTYTPITFGGSDAQGVAPLYYGILFAAMAGTGTLKQIALTTTVANVSAYAIKTSSGGLNVVIVNPDASNSLNLTLSAGQAINTASLIAMNNPSLTATPLVSGGASTTIQGSSVALNGAFSPASSYKLTPSGNNVSFYVPAMSAVIVKIT